MTSPKTIRSALLSLGLLCCSTLFALAIAEASAAVILYSKVGIVLLPPKWPRAKRHIYANWTRHVVQFDPACTQFDTQLLYTLRPGECRFQNPEFDTIIKVNSAGFRDDEESLSAPEVVVLGDSFAMGWGVDDSEAFAAVLERRTGLKVLNTGVSSYGTVREKIALSRIPVSHLKYLVVQYSSNDLGENHLFYLRNNTHKSLAKENFDRVMRTYRESRSYYPGKILDLFISRRVFGRLMRQEVTSPPTIDPWTESDRRAKEQKPSQTEAELFVNALVNAGSALPPSLQKIVVFALEAYGAENREMIEGLASMKAEHRLDGIPGEFVIVNTANILTSDDYYRLDDHIRPSGHAAVAEALASQLLAR